MIKLKKIVTAVAIVAVVLVTGCKKEDSPKPASTSTTSTTIPSITAKSPSSNATNVALNKVISVTFSEAMDATTISATTFYLKQGTTPIVGTVGYSGTTATFTPSMALIAGMVYSATMTTSTKSAAGISLALNTTWNFTTGSNATGLAVVGLGTAANYVILAKTAINNNPTSVITGDLGLSPAATSYITGLPITNATGYATSAQVTGKIFAADMASPTSINLTTAVNDMITAYNDAAGRNNPDFSELGTGNIGGKVLTEGLYKWSNTVTAPSNVIISGSSTDVWIFQIAGNLSVSSGVKITLSGGAQAKNIFWQIAGTVNIGTTAQFKGVILSKTGITLQTGAAFNGRALAQTAVILDGNIVTIP
jgi:Ice-binding-like/Bacterial Ig-like domain